MKNLYNLFLRVLDMGDESPEPEEMPVPATKVMIFLSVVLSIVLLASNLAALKIWALEVKMPVHLLPLKSYETIILPVDAGIWLFPLSYIAGDLLVNTFGKKLANLVAIYTSFMSVFIALVLWLARYLPDFPGVDNNAFAIIQGATGRIFLASIVGFLAGQITNNCYFTIIRETQKSKSNNDNQKAIRKRVLLSSIPAHFVDSLLFEFLAFWGRVSAMEFVMQITFAFVAAVLMEGLLSWKLTPWLAQRITNDVRYSDGKKI